MTYTFPNVTQQQTNTPQVVHNDRALKEFIQGEERCLKFINQDLTFLQESHIPSTFTNVSYTIISLSISYTLSRRIVQHQSSTTHSNSQTIESDNVQKQPAEHPSDYHPQLDDIPELETDEENWDEGQFDDTELLYNHNSTEESNRIHCEYSAHFEKVEEQQYSPYHTMQGVKYVIPEPDYYHSNAQTKQYQKQ